MATNDDGVTTYSLPACLQKYGYIEGSIKKFPDELLRQISSGSPKDFATGLWGETKSRQTLTKSLKGNPIKFVRDDDAEMKELHAGRFYLSAKKQIIVVGIPNTAIEGQVHYVIVRWHHSNTNSRGPENWSGHYWNVWRPANPPPGYYDGLPFRIVRVERHGRAPVSRTDERPVPAVDVTSHSSVADLNEGCIASDQVCGGQSFDPEEGTSHTSKRKQSSDTEPELSAATAKKVRTDDEESNSSIAPAHPHANSHSAAETSQIHQIDADSLQRPDSSFHHADTRLLQKSLGDNEGYDSSSSDATRASKHMEEANKRLPKVRPRPSIAADQYVKSEIVKMEPMDDKAYITKDHDGPGTPIKTLSSRMASALTPDNQFTPSTAREPSRRSSGNLPSRRHMTVGLDTVDLTDERSGGNARSTTYQNVSIRFVDSRGVTQQDLPFDKCKTARSLFEEACAFDIADKDTRMLGVEIPTIKKARIRKDDNDHFEQMVLRPLNQILQKSRKEEKIVLVVRKYM